jgi:hypothetical protein
MKEKDQNRIKQTLIYLGWGFIGMLSILILMLIAAIAGWGI